MGTGTDSTAVYVDVYGDVYVYGTTNGLTAVYGNVDVYVYVDGNRNGSNGRTAERPCVSPERRGRNA